MKMSVFLLWLVFSLTATLAYADTPVIGFIEQDTVWTRAESPYVTLGRVIVRQGVTLSIEPGTTIKFGAEHGLVIEGILIAQGTAGDLIRFISEENEKFSAWEGISFEDSSAGPEFDAAGNYLNGSIMQYCIVKYASTAIQGKSPFIDHCTISNNRNAINVFGGSAIVIKNSTISDTFSLEIVANDSDNFTLTGCTLKALDDYYRELNIHIDSCKTVLMNNNTIEGKRSLSISRISTRWCDNVTIADNAITMASIEIGKYESNVADNREVVSFTISNNIMNNGAFAFGSGLAIYGKSKGNFIARIIGNTIVGYEGYNGGGIDLDYCGDITVKGNSIIGNRATEWDKSGAGGGIYVHNCNGIISENTVAENWSNEFGGGISAEWSNVTITNNSLIGNRSRHGAGISTRGSNVVISNNFVSQNIGSHCGGIYAEGDSVKVTNNTMTKNNSSGEPSAAAAIDFRGYEYNDRENYEISSNLIAYNTSLANTVSVEGDPIFTENAFVRNQTKYDLYCNRLKGLPNFDATNNYWGLTNEAEIRGRIHDFFQNENLANVNVIPFLNENPFGVIGADIRISAFSYTFEIVPVGRNSDWTVTISNVGDSVLVVNSVVPNNPSFTIVSPSFPQSVLPNNNLDLIVRFAPDEEKSYMDIIEITSNGLNESIFVRGNGALASYVPGKRCGTCHMKTFKDARTTSHNMSFNLLTDIGEENTPECLPCHTTGYAQPGGFVDIISTPDLVGVTCQACHGPGSNHVLKGLSREQRGLTIWKSLEEFEAACMKCHDSVDWEKLTELTLQCPFWDISPIGGLQYSPESPAANRQITFDASASNDPNGATIYYEWDFGDGSTASGIKPTHSYHKSGTYTVILTMMDDDGNTTSKSADIPVSLYPSDAISVPEIGPPTLDFANADESKRIKLYEVIQQVFNVERAKAKHQGRDEDHLFNCMDSLLRQLDPKQRDGDIRITDMVRDGALTEGAELYVNVAGEIAALLFSKVFLSGMPAPMLGTFFGETMKVLGFEIGETLTLRDVHYVVVSYPTIGRMEIIFRPSQNKMLVNTYLECSVDQNIFMIIPVADDHIGVSWFDYISSLMWAGVTRPPEALVREPQPEIEDVQIIVLHSPAELRIYDSKGQVTGLIQGEIRNEIPGAYYYGETVVIFAPSDSYRYEVAGMDAGAYGLTVFSVADGEEATFVATDIPISPQATHQYTIIDWDALSNGEEAVTVQIDADGDGVFEETVLVDDRFGQAVTPEGKLPTTWSEVKRTQLLQNYPNPFNPDTWIPYTLAEQNRVVIKIHSATGELVRTLDLGNKSVGVYFSKDKAAYWDGRNDTGDPVASGVYFYTLSAGDYTATKKMVVAR